MALTNVYVDPAIAGNSGTGTIGDPYGDLQYALNTMTRDATNGDRLNIKAGTAEVMAAAIDLTTYGTPTQAAPLVFQGYTSAAGDGGIGEINNGGANVAVISSTTLDFINFIDMKLGNTGSAQILRLDDWCLFLNVEFHTSSAASAVQVGSLCSLERCYFHSITGSNFNCSSGTTVRSCYFVVTSAVLAATLTGGSFATFCIINLGHTGASGLALTNSVAANCSVYNSTAGTSYGIEMSSGVNIAINNIITGFSGAGGTGINDGGGEAHIQGKNAFYNNTTNEDTSHTIYYAPANITLTNAPFTNPGAGDFSISAAAKAELQSNGWPSTFYGDLTTQYLDPGAAQIQPSGGGAIFGGNIVR